MYEEASFEVWRLDIRLYKLTNYIKIVPSFLSRCSSRDKCWLNRGGWRAVITPSTRVPINTLGVFTRFGFVLSRNSLQKPPIAFLLWYKICKQRSMLVSHAPLSERLWNPLKKHYTTGTQPSGLCFISMRCYKILRSGARANGSEICSTEMSYLLHGAFLPSLARENMQVSNTFGIFSWFQILVLGSERYSVLKHVFFVTAVLGLSELSGLLLCSKTRECDFESPCRFNKIVVRWRNSLQRQFLYEESSLLWLQEYLFLEINIWNRHRVLPISESVIQNGFMVDCVVSYTPTYFLHQANRLSLVGPFTRRSWAVSREVHSVMASLDQPQWSRSWDHPWFTWEIRYLKPSLFRADNLTWCRARGQALPERIQHRRPRRC